MITEIILGVLIIALLVYIIVIRLKLARLNLLIESTVSRLSGMEKSRDAEEIRAFLEELKISRYFGSSKPDKLLSKEITDFIFEDYSNMRIFLHYTREENDAKKILSDGFRFADSFYKTALPVTKDNLDLKIKHNNRKLFGDYLVIITIANDIVNFYSMELAKAGIKDSSFENMLTETPPEMNENSDRVFQLSPRFIKGYINYRTGVITKNPLFDPCYDCPSFHDNVAALKTTKT
jgi:hypothetical protein